MEELHLPVSENGMELYEALKRGNYIALDYLLSKVSLHTNTNYNEEHELSWYNALQAHYDSEKYDNYNENLLRCLQLAFASSWTFASFAPELIQFIGGYFTELPQCYAYLQAEGHIG